MNKHHHNDIRSIAMLAICILLAGCSAASAQTPTPTALPPTQTPQPTITPTPTEIPFYLDASVWSADLGVPILIYHQFVPDYMNTDATQMRLSDFKAELQAFYEAGFTLIRLKDWLEGTVVVPDGRKPMVITIDDLWFGNQIYIRDDGNPSPNSGIGVLWQFSQEHPDFGFHAALFAIYGDKYYPEKEVYDSFYRADNVDYFSKSWHIKLGNTIAWAMQHGLEVYNHTFQHPSTWPTKNTTEVQDQLARNDNWLRTFLTEADHADLIPDLENMIALPEGKWPDSDAAKQVILNYKNPEGDPLLGVMEAYNMNAAQLTPSAFSPNFDPFHVARITASSFMTQFIIEHKDEVPTLMPCQLGPLPQEQAGDLEVLRQAIQNAIRDQVCPEGVYNVQGYVFEARSGNVTLVKENAYSVNPTP